LLVCLLHKSGLIFAILYFIPLKKWKPFSIVTILVLCGLIGCTGITGHLYELYATYINIPPDTSPYSADSSIRIAYMLEVVFFAWIIIANYKSIEPTRRNLIFLNTSWIFCIILLLFIRSSDGGRIAWYFTVGIIYTVTSICASPKNRFREPRALSYIMIVVMLALYARVYFVWQDYNFLYPYKTFLSDGYRSPDYARERYEYDTNYDQDKFYRPTFRFLK
nr:EpsG family protein [Muribaculaceae bacterium]